jgi:hypothetical protein
LDEIDLSMRRDRRPLASGEQDASCNRDHLASEKTRKETNDMRTSSARALALGTAIAASMGIGYAIGAQPHMTETISLLQSARGELAQATPNKGGHRERALGLIDQAIGEVHAGIAFAGD